MTTGERLAWRWLWAVVKASVLPAVYVFCDHIEPFSGRFFGGG